jgi:hypothetical protein
MYDEKPGNMGVYYGSILPIRKSISNGRDFVYISTLEDFVARWDGLETWCASMSIRVICG